MNRNTEGRIVRLERSAGFGALTGDVSRLSDAELARAIYEQTGIPAAEQTEEVLARLASEIDAEAHSRPKL